MTFCLLSLLIGSIQAQSFSAGEVEEGGDVSDYATGDISEVGGISDYPTGDFSWDISWDRNFSWGSSASDLLTFVTPFSEPGEILPGLNTMSLLLYVNEAMSKNTTKEALADLCTNFGPLLNYILQDTPVDVQSICQPILMAVNDDEDLDGVSEVCQAVWDGYMINGDMMAISEGDISDQFEEEILETIDNIGGDTSQRKKR